MDIYHVMQQYLGVLYTYIFLCFRKEKKYYISTLRGKVSDPKIKQDLSQKYSAWWGGVLGMDTVLIPKPASISYLSLIQGDME